MKPKLEIPLPTTESVRSGRHARNAHHTTLSTISSKSDPFESSEICDEIQLEDFSYIKAHIPRGGSPQPLRLVSEHPSRPSNGLDTPAIGRKRSLSIAEDNPASEWETVVPDDEFEDSPHVPPRQLRRRNNFELVFHAQEIFEPGSNQRKNAVKQERHTMLAPPRALPMPPAKRSARFPQRIHSFHSTSSLYSDWDDVDDIVEQGLPAVKEIPEVDSQKKQPGQLLLVNSRPEILRSLSKTSSSTNDDPFKYDGDLYSGFLQSSAEKEVSNALHHAGESAQTNQSLLRPTAQVENVEANLKRGTDNVDEEIKVPVIREPQNCDDAPDAKPTRQLTGRIATFLRPRPQTGTETDWQTVVTEQPFDSMQQEFQDSIAKGTGSSVADVSDVTEHYYPHEYGSTEKILQHPEKGAMTGSYRMRNERQRNMPVFVPQFGSTEGGGFPWNAARSLPQSQVQSPGGTRHFSNLFCRDGSSQRHARDSILIDMESRRDRYHTIDSNVQFPERQAKDEVPLVHEKNARFRWSRIRETLGRDPPRTTLTIFDQPLYRLGINASNQSKKSSHIPHDEFLAQIPRLPFPLISLPEAAMLQHFRRERGEEDHTDPGGSFAGRGRSNTISTVDSEVLAQTPSPTRLRFSAGSARVDLTRPAPAHHAHRSNEVLRHRDSSERIADLLISSSAILDTPPQIESRNLTNRGWYKGTSRDTNTFCEGLPRVRGFSSSTLDRRAKKMQGGYLPNDGSLFSPSEVDLIETARENILSRRRHTVKGDKGERMIFVGIMLLTLFFPFIGLLALWGRFDSAVSWYTHGEMHSLTRKQRRALKQQLLAEAVAYPVLIITLAVYYSV
ncbi:hypothetical protein AK830_g12473 [Neonectria ditissima]|uniref:Uncharacterized protein n=1 Tax=Neonectria ditissima TaxID=78410 RepID=A0A0P7B5B8_9HYPO|nr:hypothetical protein AK830_g12473 [Neonectria ditissima]